jgi:hypothetical protein
MKMNKTLGMFLTTALGIVMMATGCKKDDISGDLSQGNTATPIKPVIALKADTIASVEIDDSGTSQVIKYQISSNSKPISYTSGPGKQGNVKFWRNGKPSLVLASVADITGTFANGVSTFNAGEADSITFSPDGISKLRYFTTKGIIMNTAVTPGTPAATASDALTAANKTLAATPTYGFGL